MRISQVGRTRHLALVEESPLRKVDPRTKLFISLSISFLVMIPFEKLLIFIAIYTVFLIWARLLTPSGLQIWRMKWILIFLFLLDWWLIGLDHAVVICTRLILLTGVFTLFFSTTTTRDLGLALEKLGVSYRYAFSLSLAFQSIGYLDDEWRAIREAQASRGALREMSSFRRLLFQIGDLISLIIPAVVLTTKRAWMITEAAYARGFESPNRKAFYSLNFRLLDLVLCLGTIIVIVVFYWRW
jgi:energy-coupling factor transporter transmembrane protein EcfT